jgi:hypothetical protein
MLNAELLNDTEAQSLKECEIPNILLFKEQLLFLKNP